MTSNLSFSATANIAEITIPLLYKVFIILDLKASSFSYYESATARSGGPPNN
jgi:hypothetical protein